MTVTEVKTELQKVRQARKAYRLAKDRADDFEQTIMCGKAVRYGGSGESHERRGNPVERAYCDIVSLHDEAEQYRTEYITAFERARYLIGLVSDPAHREVLERRYIRVQLWEDLAAEMS